MRKRTKNVYINIDGTIQYIYDDQLADLHQIGQTNIRRASHVEPTEDGRWTADLQPSGGPILGPYRLRQEALDAETVWLEEHLCRGRTP